MRKQFGLAIATLTLSMAIVGCSSKTATPSENTSNEVTTEASTSPETSTAPEVSTEPEASTAPETSTEPLESATPEPTKEPEATTAPEPTKAPEAEAKPEATKAPEATQKPVATSKPQASTKPEATVKPEASTKPTATPKPEATPTPAPTPQPSASPETTGLSASEIYTQMTAGLEFASQVSVDDTLLQDLYGIDPSILESYCVKMPMLSFSISEVGVFKVKDIKDVATVVAGINKRAESVGQMLYPSLVETFEGRKVITRGHYILFAMDEAADTIAGNFNRLIK